MDVFPWKPILDKIIVREIPLEEYFQQSENVQIPLDDSRIKERSDRGIVVAIGEGIPLGNLFLAMPVAVGDMVKFDEFCQYDPFYLEPADKYRNDIPKYWEMRVGDIKGINVARRSEIVDAIQERRQIQELQNMPVAAHA